MEKKIQRLKIAIAVFLCIAAVAGIKTQVQAGVADNSLASLSLSEGTLSPAFEGGQLKYTASVGADTTSVEVNAKTVNPEAKIVEITGNSNLGDGENVIKVVVEAQNGNRATYSINVTRGAASDNNAGDTGTNTGAADMPEDTDIPQTPAANADGYTVSNQYKQSDIPTDFTKTTLTYQDAECRGFKFDKGELTLLYMTNESGAGAFFVYDAASKETYPYIRLNAGEHYIILMKQSENNALAQADLTIEDTVFNGAYQEMAGDFYQIYAMNDAGTAGWYQYDAAEGTFQRYEFPSQEDDEEEAEYTDNQLQKDYGELQDKYNAKKDLDIKIIAGFIVAVVLLIFVIINILMRGKREDRDESGIFDSDSETDSEEQLDDLLFEDEKPKKAKEKKAKKKPAQAEDEWEEDKWEDTEEFEDFEEEPAGFFDDKPEKKEKKIKPEKHHKSKDIFDEDEEDHSIFSDKPSMPASEDTEEDDMEVMDLNDL